MIGELKKEKLVAESIDDAVQFHLTMLRFNDKSNANTIAVKPTRVLTDYADFDFGSAHLKELVRTSNRRSMRFVRVWKSNFVDDRSCVHFVVAATALVATL